MRASPMERSNRFRSDHALRFIIARQPAVRRELVDEALSGLSQHLPRVGAERAREFALGDLMKLFKLDSSLGARKQLAKELGYTGVLDGSAEMNIWLHRQVMVKLAESGGKVPEHLKA